MYGTRSGTGTHYRLTWAQAVDSQNHPCGDKNFAPISLGYWYRPYDLLKPLCIDTLVPINLGTSSAELIYKTNWSRIFVYDNLARYRYYFKVESNALQTPTTVVPYLPNQ